MIDNPYTIRIHVPDGDPEGVRVVDNMNWTGVGVAFPRDKWKEVSQRNEFNRACLYILIGYSEEEEDLPTIYIGESDDIRGRIESHLRNKEFWDRAIIFTSKQNELNKAHIKWLEYSALEQASKIGQCRLDNNAKPKECSLNEFEKADIQTFWKEILKILPLLGVTAFEKPKIIKIDVKKASSKAGHEKNTIVIPAKEEGFQGVFIGENCWYSIRISGGMLDKIKYIAAYQTSPICAITHYAKVERIEPYGENGKYKVIFKESACEIPHIPYGDAPSGAMQSSRYTNFEKLKTAKKLADLF